MGKREKREAEHLDKGLSALQAGEIDASGFAISEQSSSEELTALLKIAMHTHQAFQPPDPDQRFIEQSERRLLKVMRTKMSGRDRHSHQHPRVRLLGIPTFVTVLLVVGFLVTTLGVVTVSAASLPGDRLYPFKRGFEEVQLALSGSPQGDIKLLSKFSDERLSELEALQEAGRVNDLEPAIDQYLTTLDQLFEAELALKSGGASESVEAVDTLLSKHAKTLLRVQDQVPEQAKSAIQIIIDRLTGPEKEKGVEGEGQEQEQNAADRRATQTVRAQERENEKNLRTAEQLARKYGRTVDQVLTLFHGVCLDDWKCVREWYRDSGK